MGEQSQQPIVVITGSSGLLGTALVAALTKRYRVVGLDLVTGKAGCEEIEADLTSSESTRAALDTLAERHGRRIAAVIHLAASYDVTGEEHPLYEKLNVDGTRRLLESLRDFEVERLVYASTMLVHRPGSPGVPIDESAEIAPAWIYPESKAAAEAVIEQHRSDMPCTILRLAGAYSDTGGVPTLVEQIRRIYERTVKSMVFAGDSSHGQSMVHIEDAIDAFERAVDRRAELPELSAILIGEPRPLSYEAQQHLIARELHGESGATLSVPKPLAKAGAWIEERSEPVVPDAIDQGEKPFIRPFMIDLSSDHYELDISRAKSQLGWQPRHSLRDVLPRICAALERDPLQWYRDNGLTPPAWLEQLGEVDERSAQELESDFESRYREEHAGTRWAQFVNMGLAAWLVSTPFSHGYTQPVMALSDVLAGAALFVFATLSLSWRFGLMRWAQAAVGAYLLSAPLLFWAEDAAAYLNGTLVGAVVIGLSVAVKPPPGVAPLAVLTGPTIPDGWRFSPSKWTQRLPIIVLAFVGLIISRYLAAYQLGHIGGVWEPFFRGTTAAQNGTEQIITSSVSRAWPVPDAGLGALTYMFEILTGLIGSAARWRTLPWLVTLFGIMIVPLGAVSIFFIVIQPIVIGTWCTLCLLAAAAMLIQIPYSLDELVATGQFLMRRKRAGRSLLRIFFVGDTDDGGEADDAEEFDRRPAAVIFDCLTGGVNVPWNLFLCIAIGVFLMLTRLAVGAEPPMSHADHLIGALVVTVSVTALAEVARPVRFLNLLLGAGLMGAPWLFEGGGGLTLLVDSTLGLALIALCLPRGAIRNTYGNLTRYLV
jgi:nucleoside-diphosphate-sugar epimerase/uncharacterized membrane protein